MNELSSIVKDNLNIFKNKFKYPLCSNKYNEKEITKMINVLINNQLTMSSEVKLFEKEFAEYIGSKYAVMVNSGSSANLLAMAVATNYLRKKKLNKGDKILIPAICWSTSVYPIIQMGLIPVFVDIDPTTLNMDLDDCKKKIDKNTKGIVAVHILGNCTNMDKLMKIVKDNDLFLMEDTCESLSSKYKDKYLGTFGDFGTYSFYYSHHITTVEGGMVVCNSEEDYELLKCLRAHGWTRSLKNKESYKNKYPDIDDRFLFINVGYNLRPMEIQGAMGRIQLQRLNNNNLIRNKNYYSITNKIMNDPRNKNHINTVKDMENSEISWFNICFILNNKEIYKDYLKYLTDNGVENRPIVTGNFTRQPVCRLMNLNYNPTDYVGAEIIHFRGFFIGLPNNELNKNEIDDLVNIILNYFE